jgi:XTP/dITP diphosphohydrolase
MDLVFVTNNKHKLREIKNLLGNQVNLLSLEDISFEGEIPETHETIEENAAEKAFFIYNMYKINCFADDTGLEIEALNGEPGVYSSRYAGDNVTYDDNIKKVLDRLKDSENRKARFRTVLCLILDGKEYSFEGTVNGLILEEKSGKSGFGYDPVFVPDGFDKTFAELSITEKNLISHRGKAIQKLKAFLENIVV